MIWLRSVALDRDKVPSFDEHPYDLPLIRGLEEIRFEAPVTFLVGENGSGKSTLIEAIAVRYGFNPEGGSKNFNFSTYEHSGLHDALRLVRAPGRPADGYFLRAESFFNVATEIDARNLKGWYGGRSLHAMSHGESFWTLVTERLFGGGLYIFDEPEAALSPGRQLALMARMHELVADASQFVIATHSPILMGYPGAAILQIEDGRVSRVEYEETEHYRVTRHFLNHRERMLRELLGPE